MELVYCSLKYFMNSGYWYGLKGDNGYRNNFKRKSRSEGTKIETKKEERNKKQRTRFITFAGSFFTPA